MKKIFTLFSFGILTLISANADNVSVKSAVTVNPGKDAQTVTISLTGEKIYSACQMDITLPNGYSFEKNDYGELVNLYDGKIYTYAGRGGVPDHTFDAKVQDDGSLRVSITGNSNADMTATSGDLFDIYIKANSWAKPGAAEIKISGAKLIPSSGTSTVLADQTISDKLTTSTSCTLSIPAGWSTCLIPFAPTLPSTVKVYDVNSVSGTTVSLTDASSIGDYKPYVVYNSGDATSLTGTILATYPSGTTTNGKLVGVLAATKISSGYVLQKHESTTAFYNVASEITVPAGKAYLDLSGSAKSGDVLYFEVPTAIQNVVTTADSESIYDLNGMKVTTPHHGVYIKGGKKVVMK